MGRHDLKAGARFRRVVIAAGVVVVACAVLALIPGTAAPAAVAWPAQAGLRLSVDRQLAIGDGTVVLSVRLPWQGALTVTQASGGPILLQPLHQRVGTAGSLTLVLKPTAAGQTLERQGGSIHLTALLTFRPADGGTITRLIPIAFERGLEAPGERAEDPSSGLAKVLALHAEELVATGALERGRSQVLAEFDEALAAVYADPEVSGGDA